MKYSRTLAAAAVAGTATLALLTASGTSAQAHVIDYPKNTNVQNPSWHGTRAHLYPVVDAHHKASYAYVSSGRLHVQARAQCQRRNGGTSWYQSTIRVGAGGGKSHYDCDNNGTYNRAVVGLGVDIN
jgi:hypothetical protein